MIARREQAGSPAQRGHSPVTFDPLRAFVFPNNLREMRRGAGFQKLLQLSQKIPEIPYIRLSKIERGEVFARPDELARVAALLGIEPLDLLLDVEDPAFDLAAWAAPFADPEAIDPREEQFAVLLGAALHMRRSTDRSLSVAALNEKFRLPPVIVSRIENAAKTIDRWNDHVVDGLLRLFGVRSITALRRLVETEYKAGRLDPYVQNVSNPELRREKTRGRIAELRRQLLEQASPVTDPASASIPPLQSTETSGDTVSVRLLDVVGMPLPDGLIAPVATGETVAAPLRSGPRAYGLRLGRPTLGAGMPGNAVLVVDPDRYPASGGLAVVAEGANRRVVSVIADRHGAMKGYSEHPDREIAIDRLDPAEIAAVIGASFV